MPPVLARLSALLLLLACAALHAQPRAWLDRNRIALGESVTLNIENDRDEAPDYAPLQAGFELDGRTSSTRFELFNGRATLRTQFSVNLSPRRAGALTVPALAFGNGRTAPLNLQVDAVAAPVRAGGEVFIESQADDSRPYVQQNVGWVVRLYTSVSIVSGQLDQPAPSGASLQRVGGDAQYVRDIGGVRYQVLERRFVLIPERSGALAMPPARFRGRAVAGFFDRVFGDGVKDLAASAAPRTLAVRAMPAGAPQPWLPLRALQLRYRTVPQALVAGEAATLEVEAVADGARSAQLPALELPPVPGLQVFPDAPERSDRLVDGRPVATLARRFALVPQRAGAVVLHAPRIGWWDVRAGRARVAALPALQLRAGPARGAAAASPGLAPRQVAPGTPGARRWALAAVAFALLWLLTLAWALRTRPSASGPSAPDAREEPDAPDAPRNAGAHALDRALKSGDLADIADALQALAGARTLQQFAGQLPDPAQRDAIDALQRARWAGGDAADARARLRAAFARGVVTTRDAAPPPLLPPLYPAP